MSSEVKGRQMNYCFKSVIKSTTSAWKTGHLMFVSNTIQACMYQILQGLKNIYKW